MDERHEHDDFAVARVHHVDQRREALVVVEGNNRLVLRIDVARADLEQLHKNRASIHGCDLIGCDHGMGVVFHLLVDLGLPRPHLDVDGALDQVR